MSEAVVARPVPEHWRFGDPTCWLSATLSQRKWAYRLPITRDDYPASNIVCTTAPRLLRPCKTTVSQIELLR